MKRWLILIALIWACWGTVWPDSAAYAFDANDLLCWNPSTDNVAVGGYKVHFGNSSGVYTGFRDVGLTATPSAPCVAFGDLSLVEGSYFFAVTAYDTSQNESGFSNEVAAFFDVTVPSVPGNVRILRIP